MKGIATPRNMHNAAQNTRRIAMWKGEAAGAHMQFPAVVFVFSNMVAPSLETILMSCWQMSCRCNVERDVARGSFTVTENVSAGLPPDGHKNAGPPAEFQTRSL